MCTSFHGPKDGLVWVYCAAGAWQGEGGPRLSPVIPRQKAPGAGGGNRKRAPAGPLSTFSTSRCCFMAVRESLTTHLLPQSPSGGDSRSLAGATQRDAPEAQKPCLQSQESSCNPTHHLVQEAAGSWLFLGTTSRFGSDP